MPLQAGPEVRPRRRRHLAVTLALFSALCPTPAHAELPNVDVSPAADVDVGSANGLLTGPSSRSPEDAALGYVLDHHGAFGLDRDDVAALRLVARDVSPDGITHLRWNQVVDGLSAFDAGLEAHVTRDGRLIAVTGAPVADPALTAGDVTTPAEALRDARRHGRGASLAPRSSRTRPGPSRATTFSSGESAALRWATTADGPRRAWDVLVVGDDHQTYQVLVDAETGALLRRQDLTEAYGKARWWSVDPSRSSMETTTMPPAWFDDNAGGTRLWGNFARTYIDASDEDPAWNAEVGGNRVQLGANDPADPNGPDWLFGRTTFPGASPCPSSGCTWDSTDASTAFQNAWSVGASAHVLVSRYHDHLAAPPIGFDEASGNFQRVNATGAGEGNDAVRVEIADAFFKGNRNNADFSTPPDGGAPRMQLRLFTVRDVHAGESAHLVYHEYTHGLSSRLVANASGSSALSAIQSRMLGEGWSDFYAADFLVGEGSVTDSATPGELDLLEHVAGPGARAKPLDCPVAPAGLAGCNGTQGAAVAGGYTYGDLAGTDNSGPHNGGELWAETLWDIRAALGPQMTLALVTGGMRLTPDDPSMLDARDAILQQAIAQRSAPGAADDHYAALWAIFANRGMGRSATTPSATSTTPVEAFDAPAGVRARGSRLRDPYPGGDADGKIEPGETFTVEQDVQGIGSADLPGATGTLSAPGGGFTILDASATWGLLGKGRTAANSDPLVARLDPDAGCLVPRTLSVGVSTAEGPVQATVPVDPRVGSKTELGIPDATDAGNATVESSFVVERGGAITDVDVRIDELRHRYLGDLWLELEHDGVEAVLIDHFGDGSFDGDDLIDLVLDDEAANALPSTGAGPVTGRYRAATAGALAAFDGHPAAGTWTLRLADTSAGQGGVLRGWGITGPQVPCGRLELPAATTDEAADVTSSSATLRGAVTPNGRATGLRFAYGPTTDLGSTTPTQDVGAGDEAVARAAPIAGLPPGSTIHFRAEAIREDGVVAATGPDRVLVTTPAAAPPEPTPGPGSQAEPTPPAPAAVRLSLASVLKLAFDKRSRTTVRFIAPPGSDGMLVVAASIKRKRRTLARGSFVAAADGATKVRLTLSRASRKLLGRTRSLTVRLEAKAGGQTARKSVRLTRKR